MDLTFLAILPMIGSTSEDPKAIEGVWHVGKLRYSTACLGAVGACVASAVGAVLLPGVP